MRPLLLTLLASVAAVALHAGAEPRRERASRRDAVAAPFAPSLLGALPPPLPPPVPAATPEGPEPAPSEPEPEKPDPEEAEPGEPECPPEDPVERGSLSLFVLLADEATGEAFPSTMQLWRLDAPGNADYEAGDQLQERVEVAREGSWIRDLPAGRYRVLIHRQAPGTEDPPPFEIADRETHREFRVPRPGRFATRVRIYDENGALITRAKVRELGVCNSFEDPMPGWARLRRSRAGGEIGFLLTSGVG